MVLIEVIAVNLVASKFGQALGEKVDDDIFFFDKDISQLDLSCLFLNHKRQSLAWIVDSVPTRRFLRN